jgi:L,D-transpeptidase ErfK/SrfK
MRVTHGCIRMFPEDIEVLFRMLPVNTLVRIVNQPVKFGWLDGELYMEAHEVLATATPPPLQRPDEQALAADAPEEKMTAGDAASAADAATEVAVTVAAADQLTMMTRAFVDATSARAADADWPLMERVFVDSRGIPVRVGALRPADDDGEAPVMTVDAR